MRVRFCIQLHARTADGDDWSLFLFSGYNMEAPSFMRVTRNHADSLLANLNLQREKVQLCDCVVRQKQNPGQLYPAHRCVLAASSPVLAAILPSSGVLVELQAPCLSDSVLELLLDYIYTGTVPNAHEQQQYSLLAAACHLQMDGLQEALMHQEQSDVQDGNIIIGAESDTLSSTVDSSSCKQGAKQTPPNLAQNIPWTPEVSKGGEGALGVRSLRLPTCAATGEDQTIGEQVSHRIFTDGEHSKKTQTHHSSFLVSTSSVCTSSLDNGSPSSSSSLHVGAVSVICHGSQAAVHQAADMFTESPQHPAFPASASTTKDSQSSDGGSIYRDKLNRHSKDPFSSPKWAEESRSNTSTEESDVVGQCSTNSKEHFMKQKNEETNKRLSHGVDCDARRDSYLTDNNAKHPRVDSGSRCREKDQINPGLDNSSSKPMQCSDSGDGSVVTEQEPGIYSKDLPADDPNTGSNSQVKVVYPKGQVKEEHSYSCRRALDVARGQYENSRTESNRHTVGTAENLNTGTPASGVHHTSGHCVTRCRTALDSQPILNIEITDAGWPKTADSHTFDAAPSAEGSSYCGRLDYHCLSPKDTYLTHMPVCLSPESLDSTSSDEEPSGIVAHSCDEQNFKTWTTNEPLLQDWSPESTELVADYQREIQRLHGLDEAKSPVWFQELDVQGGVGKDRSRATAEATGKDGSWDTEDAPSSREDGTSSACTPPTPSVPSTWSVPTPSDPRNGSSHHPFQCSLCHRSFSQRGSLNRHTRSHLGVRPFPCPRCPMTFSRQYRVTEHMRVHERSALGNFFPKSTTSSVLDSKETQQE